MDFFEVVRNRHSIRDFLDKPIEPEKLQTILEAVNRAPSAGNLQAYEVYVVTDPKCRTALAHASLGQEYVAEAPIDLVFCTNIGRSAERYGDRGTYLYALQDSSVACTYAMLAAVALGLGSVWVGAFNDNEAWQAIGSPDGIMPVAILPIGYPAEQREPSRRRPLHEIMHEIR